MKRTNVVSVRMTPTRRKELEALALVDDTTLGEQIRRAIKDYTASRIREDGFREKVQAAHQRLAARLDALLRR